MGSAWQDTFLFLGPISLFSFCCQSTKLSCRSGTGSFPGNWRRGNIALLSVGWPSQAGLRQRGVVAKFAPASESLFVRMRESEFSAGCWVLGAQQLAQQVGGCWDMSGFEVSLWYSRLLQEDIRRMGEESGDSEGPQSCEALRASFQLSGRCWDLWMLCGRRLLERQGSDRGHGDEEDVAALAEWQEAETPCSETLCGCFWVSLSHCISSEYQCQTHRLASNKLVPAPFTKQVAHQGGLLISTCQSRWGSLQPLDSAALPGSEGSSFSS